MASRAFLAIVFVLLCCAPAHSQGAVVSRAYRLSIPDQKWALEVTLPTVPNLVKNQKKTEQPYAFHPATEYFEPESGFSLFTGITKDSPFDSSFTFLDIRVKAAPKLSPEEFRTLSLKNILASRSLKQNSLKTLDYNSIPIARYSMLRAIDGVNGSYNLLGVYVPTDQMSSSARHLAAFFIKDGIGATVTFSSKDFNAEREKLFYSVLDSIKFVDISQPTTSSDYFLLGKLCYLQRNYEKAVEPLAGALVLERKQRLLEPALWEDMVLDLATSLLRTGRSAAAFNALEYGIKTEPSVWEFHAALARLYASAGDADRCLASLKTTFSLLKEQHQPKLFWPDPGSENAFKTLMKDARFKEAVKTLTKN
jgi:tetratricopeptide (TPR) repeat protein